MFAETVSNMNVKPVQSVFQNCISIECKAAANIITVIVIVRRSLQIETDIGFEIEFLRMRRKR